jgi:CheY-like chemotaxis protein
MRNTEHLPALIRESAQFILSGSNVTCRYEFADDLWAVLMDKGQISQVIQNLVLNADQAMPQGGSIVITARNRLVEDNTITGLHGGPHVQLEVRDTGTGIAKENLGKIFDPYFSTKQKDSNKGSGLGLAIVHSIITKHEGIISVSSTPDAGTTFEIFLPASSKDAPQEQKETPILPTGKGLVLVMDDDETIHSIVSEMLAYLGYSTVHAYDGRETLDLYRGDMKGKQEIKAVIMDLTIPGGMGGAEAIKQLRQLDPRAKVVVSSGYSDDPVLHNYREAGFANIISKPYQLLDLSRVMAETLNDRDRPKSDAASLP